MVPNHQPAMVLPLCCYHLSWVGATLRIFGPKATETALLPKQMAGCGCGFPQSYGKFIGVDPSLYVYIYIYMYGDGSKLGTPKLWMVNTKLD